MTATVASQGTRVPDPVELAGLRVTATYKAYRQHVMGECRDCDRNDCPTARALDADASAAQWQHQPKDAA